MAGDGAGVCWLSLFFGRLVGWLASCRFSGILGVGILVVCKVFVSRWGKRKDWRFGGWSVRTVGLLAVCGKGFLRLWFYVIYIVYEIE